MALYEIPLDSQAQKFAITLAGVEYLMRLTFRDAPEGGWILDIGSNTNVPLICGIPLVPGVDLLQQYSYMNIKGQLYIGTNGDPDYVPGPEDLGNITSLYFLED